jgi:ABC-type phosphate transport system substrate-binding protein
MKMFHWLVPLLLFIFSLPCYAHHMAVVVGKHSGVTSLTSAQLGKIFRAEIKKWPDGREIVLIMHRSSPGESLTLRRLNKMSALQWEQWKLDYRESLTLVDSDKDLLDVVASIPGAIGLIDVRSVDGRVTVVRVDGRLPLEAGYLPH